MEETFVPPGFHVPTGYDGPGFRLEPLGPAHNERDHEAWTSSIEHIRGTPGFEDSDDSEWPHPMSLDQNLEDLVRHAADFAARSGFTYSILDREDVIGCLYIYPSRRPDCDAEVSSWVRAGRADLDRVVWAAISDWLALEWPFTSPHYAAR